MKKLIQINIIALVLLLFTGACQDQFEEFPYNPNVAGENDPVPPAFILRQVTYDIARGADVTEEPLEYLSRLSQFTNGLTFPLYGGSNQYNWSQTGTSYPWLRDIIKLEKNATDALGTEKNPYLAISKFLRAYTFVWLTQRVGDIPMTEAGMGLENVNPKFDTQQEVYIQSFQLLEEANNELAEIVADPTSRAIDGDIFFNNDLQKWRKAVNSFTLRVLISLSHRADDTPALGSKQKFNAILSDPARYPIYAGIEDNMNYVFLPIFNRYPTNFKQLYPRETAVSKTFLDLTTKNNDPRTFIAATPAPTEIAGGKSLSDFTAYRGADNARPQGALFEESTAGAFSYINNLRYLQGPDVIPEPYIMVGYSEMCFNIAEAMNRGWVEGNAADWYMKGIQSSLDFYQLSDGNVFQIGDVNGAPLGEVTIDVSTFLSNVEYAGNNDDGLRQILEQKYVAFWQNSGWEAYYQFRRTGIPAFSEGTGTNSQSKIPLRWQYPIQEVENNRQNATEAIQRQFGGNDDVFQKLWMLK